MTVEQNVLQQSAAQKHQQTFLNQLREITGINDAQILQQALKDSNGNLELAVAFLTAKNAKTPQQEETTYYQTALPGSDRYISVGSQADAKTEGHLRSWPPEHSLHSPAFFPSKCSSVTNCLSIGHEGKGYVNLQAEI
ncbi:ubiquitin carboxyl-terminal hydrolase 25-like isoform X9 [Equus caballus]|uniref:ubiquitin carboxyl-terminal hydrolase 25-like isoform X9 n=1 Tax=Equus caballus TaxID=9796 RepID=UPI0038B3D23D